MKMVGLGEIPFSDGLLSLNWVLLYASTTASGHSLLCGPYGEEQGSHVRRLTSEFLAVIKLMEY